MRLGLTSFGGPVAHIGFFRDEFVVRRRWLDDAAYTDLVALCQFLPGPASSQVGLAIGLIQRGYAGAIAAWLGFTLPSALVMAALGYGALVQGDILAPTFLHGLKIAALAVVANALFGMARSACTSRIHLGIALAAAIVMLYATSPFLQIAVIALAALAGRVLLRSADTPTYDATSLRFGRSAAITAACIFTALLVGLPLLTWIFPGSALLDITDAFYRVGALVFGGGHVVLPLLQAELVPTGWIDQSQFIAGYGVAQAVPGPMFTFAAYLGALVTPSGGGATGFAGAAVALLAVFLPSFLILIAILPFWSAVRAMPAARASLAGVNAAVVGLLLAALYNPVWTSSVGDGADLALALAALMALTVFRVPPWAVVIGTAIVAYALGYI